MTEVETPTRYKKSVQTSDLSSSFFLGFQVPLQGFLLLKPHIVHTGVGQPRHCPDRHTEDTGKAPTRRWSVQLHPINQQGGSPHLTHTNPTPMPHMQPLMENEWAILKIGKCSHLNMQRMTAPYQDEVWEEPRRVRIIGSRIAGTYWWALWESPSIPEVSVWERRLGAGGHPQNHVFCFSPPYGNQQRLLNELFCRRNSKFQDLNISTNCGSYFLF